MSTLLKDGYDHAFFAEYSSALSRVYSREVSELFLEKTLQSNTWEKLELKERMHCLAISTYIALQSKQLKLHKRLDDVVDALDLPLDEQSFYYIFLMDIVKMEIPNDISTRWNSYEFLSRYTTPEFVTRRDIEHHWETVRPLLINWTESPHANVRRAASEASRPRLPWGIRLRNMSNNPSRSIEILEKLMQDPSLYVQKSVANHWNDISKEYPDLVISQLSKYDLSQNNTRWIVKRALRTLLKLGNSKALALLGFCGESSISKAKLLIEKEKVTSIAPLKAMFHWRIGGNTPVKLRIDWHVTYLLKNGTLSDKTYFGSEKEWTPGEHTLPWKRSFHTISTKQYYTGEHRLSVSINGKKQCTLPFHLEVHPKR